MSRQTLPSSFPMANIPTPRRTTTFREFILLPVEIQLMVWHFAAQQSRNVDVYNLDASYSYGPDHFNGKLSMPGMLLVSKAAREVGLKHYTKVQEQSLVHFPSLARISNVTLTDGLSESTRCMKRTVYLNFQYDKFEIAKDFQEIMSDSEDEDEEDEEILLNFSQEDLGKMHHCSMQTDLLCGGRLLYLGAFFNLLDAVSIKTFTVEVNFGWKCVCEPCKQEAILPMSSMAEWESCLKDKIRLVKRGMQFEGFVWPIEFLWKHVWDTSNVFETSTLGPRDDNDREDEDGEEDSVESDNQ